MVIIFKLFILNYRLKKIGMLMSLAAKTFSLWEIKIFKKR